MWPLPPPPSPCVTVAKRSPQPGCPLIPLAFSAAADSVILFEWMDDMVEKDKKTYALGVITEIALRFARNSRLNP